MQQKIDEFMTFFPTITKEEADAIEAILEWDAEKKLAFMFAKKLFDEGDIFYHIEEDDREDCDRDYEQDDDD